MGENLKIPKDKCHRSSSSINANLNDGALERKIHERAIPEGEDHFDIADARCEDLKHTLDLVRTLKKQKRKLKKRSSTKINALDASPYQGRQQNQEDEEEELRDSNRFISVTAKPKRKLIKIASEANTPQSRARRNPDTLTRPEISPRYYANHDLVHPQRADQSYTEEYLRSIQQLPNDSSQHTLINGNEPQRRLTRRISRIDPGDGPMIQRRSGTASMMESGDKPPVVRRKQKIQNMSSPSDLREQHRGNYGDPAEGDYGKWSNKKDDRPVVELFNKSQQQLQRNHRREKPSRRAKEPDREDDIPETRAVNNSFDLGQTSKTSTFINNGEFGVKSSPSKIVNRVRRRGRYSSRGYELPTVASKMKQKGMRCNYVMSNVTSIPFCVTKSTSPSHNIGANLQQVLNGMKMQQPITNIPLTIAHHMGLRHTNSWGPIVKPKITADMTLDVNNINVIQLGRRLLRLPSYKYVSYRRLLHMYQEGDGMVPRFLRAMSRPTYFYQPTFGSEEDAGYICTGSIAPLSTRASRQEVKQSLAEYANLNREYQILTQNAKKGTDRETERRLEELAKELAAREEHIRQVVMTYNDGQNLRSSASTIGGLECARSTFKMNVANEF